MMSNAMAIAMTGAFNAVNLDEPLAEQLKAAMRVTVDHWLLTDESDRLKAAGGAVITANGTESETAGRLAWELRQIAKLSAILNSANGGAPVDLAMFEDAAAEGFYPVGIMKLWYAVKDELTRGDA